jgi:hypothetical protein
MNADIADTCACGIAADKLIAAIRDTSYIPVLTIDSSFWIEASFYTEPIVV